MKPLLLLLLLSFAGLTYGQTNFYIDNTDSVLTEMGVQKAFETTIKNIPAHFKVTPTIYHRIVKKDSIINYYVFAIVKCDSRH